MIDARRRRGADRHALDLKEPKLAPERPPRARRAGLKARDVALYIYTSGTTGMPKAAKITHMRAQLYMRAFAGATGAKAEDMVYCALPLYHSTGGLCGVGSALLNGGTLVLRRKFSATHFWDDIADHGCTMFVYIGELCRYLVNQPPHPKERAHQLRLAFGNGLRPDVWDRVSGALRRSATFWSSTARPKATCRCSTSTASPARSDACRPICASNFAVRLVKFDVEAEAAGARRRTACASMPSPAKSAKRSA